MPRPGEACGVVSSSSSGSAGVVSSYSSSSSSSKTAVSWATAAETQRSLMLNVFSSLAAAGFSYAAL